MSPSITLIHNSESKILFNNELQEFNSNNKVLMYVKTKFLILDTDAIIIIRCNYEYSIDKLIEFIKFKKISNITFFIDDVFRISYNSNLNLLDTYMIEDENADYDILELDVIKNILECVNTTFEIYHCEVDTKKYIYKKFNINLRYFDIFLINYARYSSFSEIENFNLKFKNKISCFNNRGEIHRFFIASLLSSSPNCLISLNHRFNLTEVQIMNKSLPLDKFSSNFRGQLLTAIKNLDIQKLLLDSPSVSMLPPSIQHSHVVIDRISNSFLNVVTETRFSSPMQNISEKTIKPILAGRPFIVLAPPFHLKMLHELGFKTFDKWWNEDYDTIEDHNLRFEKIYNLIIEIINKPDKELQNILLDMQEILIHNYNNLSKLEEKMLNYSLVLP